ncbi:right-handed parallel beta-helix repeat-containing protein [Carboxylicivirga sp. M1479]|uniref:right-handed parallel beta-helix repeat-containing protein n=1 Tax=Carboxylicivirga sp. M1479 TaxID=2594476 RepID=UPI001178C433|nr:right-handed parallel beta-helix repeat-containing protein [Carboxylicivirga sp. M1479]TRX66346.1 right-handed parallel beta-helix repeat-containing protein [Carboxylicivirga sp. M1479]
MRWWQFIPIVFCLLFIGNVEGQNIFPGSEGFGTDSRGAYAGDQLPKVIKVTNLEDGGPGSLRSAINQRYPRIIVFEVSGVIELQRTMRIRSPYVYIAGQTAPYPGITLKNYSLGISSHDVLVQGLKIRPGIYSNEQIDGINIADDPDYLYNIVVDRCSVSWGLDENIGILNGGAGISISNCIISEGLEFMNHSMGLLAMDTEQVSVIKNIFIHNADRNPLIIGDCKEALVANNLIYNSDTHAMYLGFKGPKGIALKAALLGNVYIQGKENRNEYILSINKDFNVLAKVYLSRNKTQGITTNKQWSSSLIHNPGNKAVGVEKNPVIMPEFEFINESELKKYLLNSCGAHAKRRDSVDLRLLQELKNYKGTRIKTPSDVGGYEYTSNTRALDLPDKMHEDDDQNGFTNLEEWLNAFLD